MKFLLVPIIFVFAIFNSGKSQSTIEINRIDTINAFSIQIHFSTNTPLFYSLDWSKDWKSFKDSLTISLPSIVTISTSNNNQGDVRTFNFSNLSSSSWVVTASGSGDFINYEIFQSGIRKQFNAEEYENGLFDTLNFYVSDLLESRVFNFGGVEDVTKSSETTMARIFAGYLLYVSGMQDFRPMPLHYFSEKNTGLKILWVAEHGEFEPQEGDLHYSLKEELAEKYVSDLSDFFGWSFSGYKIDTTSSIINGRYYWGEPIKAGSETTNSNFLLLDQVMAHPKHVERAKSIMEKEWKDAMSWYSMYGGVSFKNWSTYFQDWLDNCSLRRDFKKKNILENFETEKLTVRRFLGEEGQLLLGGIVSDTMLYELDWIKGDKISVEALAQKDFRFEEWNDTQKDSVFEWTAEKPLSLQPIFKPQNVRKYRKIKTLESKNIYSDITTTFPEYYFYFVILLIIGVGVIIFRA